MTARRWNDLQWDGGTGHYEVYYVTLTDPGTGVGFASAIMPALIILYLNSKDIKSQFIDSYDDQA